MDIAEILRRALEAKGWSRARLAKEVGVSRQTVSAWLKGSAAPTRRRAPVVAKILDIPLSTISGDPGRINVAEVASDSVQKRLVPLLDWVDAGRGAEVASTYAIDGEYDRVIETGDTDMTNTATQIGPYTVIEHTETVKPERFVVFWDINGHTVRCGRFGRNGGFRTLAEAIDAVEKTVKYGTTNV